MQEPFVWVLRTVPLTLEADMLVLWAQYVGAVSMELESRIEAMGVERAGPMSWDPIGMGDDEVTYEFRMPYSGNASPDLRIIRDT